MKRKKRVRRKVRMVVAFIACAVLFCNIGFAAGNSYTKMLEAHYSNIQLVIDDVTVTPKDVNGNVVDPFIVDGTTYLPVRAVSQALGKSVDWDGNTRTVYVGKHGDDGMSLMKLCPPYQKYMMNTLETVKMTGNMYVDGICLGGNNLYNESFMLFNLNGKYNTLSFDLGHIDGKDMKEGTFKLYLDGELAFSTELNPQSLVRHYDVPLNGALQMKFTVKPAYIGEYFAMVNARLS